MSTISSVVSTPGRPRPRSRRASPPSRTARWAVGRSKPESVAPPIDIGRSEATMPEMRSARPAPLPARRSVADLEVLLVGRALSMTTSFGPGHSPATRASGLNRESFAIEKPRFGAPPKTIASLSRSISVVDSLSTPPRRLRRLRPRWTWPQALVERGAGAPLPSKVEGRLPVMRVDALADVGEDESNAWSIESVRTYVPLTMATPRTIAIAVRVVRSLRPSRPFRAKRSSSG